MTTVEEVICKAKELAKTAGEKTGELVNFGKLKLSVAETERTIRSKYEEIGRLSYGAHTDGANADEAIGVLCEEIDALQQTVVDLTEQMDILRHTRHCASCGKTNPKDADFCQKCGEEL